MDHMRFIVLIVDVADMATDGVTMGSYTLHKYDTDTDTLLLMKTHQKVLISDQVVKLASGCCIWTELQSEIHSEIILN